MFKARNVCYNFFMIEIKKTFIFNKSERLFYIKDNEGIQYHVPLNKITNVFFDNDTFECSTNNSLLSLGSQIYRQQDLNISNKKYLNILKNIFWNYILYASNKNSGKDSFKYNTDLEFNNISSFNDPLIIYIHTIHLKDIFTFGMRLYKKDKKFIALFLKLFRYKIIYGYENAYKKYKDILPHINNSEKQINKYIYSLTNKEKDYIDSIDITFSNLKLNFKINYDYSTKINKKITNKNKKTNE
jgi:hypothetical protein